jgi:hypothetical protein
MNQCEVSITMPPGYILVPLSGRVCGFLNSDMLLIIKSGFFIAKVIKNSALSFDEMTLTESGVCALPQVIEPLPEAMTAVICIKKESTFSVDPFESNWSSGNSC